MIITKALDCLVFTWYTNRHLDIASTPWVFQGFRQPKAIAKVLGTMDY